MNPERRFMPMQELRFEKREDGAMIIEGYPIVYEQPAVMYGAWKEIIARGAASKALARSNELVLWNHKGDQPMARRSNGTLSAVEDEHGVKIVADVSKTRWGRDGFEAVQSGTIDKMSFAFDLAPRGQTWDVEKDEDGIEIDVRTITEFGEIYDYSPVAYPAYEGTEVQARSKELAYAGKPTITREDPESEPPAESQADEAEERQRSIDTDARERELTLLEKESV
jgi:HK97 family phage prohead protease